MFVLDEFYFVSCGFPMYHMVHGHWPCALGRGDGLALAGRCMRLFSSPVRFRTRCATLETGVCALRAVDHVCRR